MIPGRRENYIGIIGLRKLFLLHRHGYGLRVSLRHSLLLFTMDSIILRWIIILAKLKKDIEKWA